MRIMDLPDAPAKPFKTSFLDAAEKLGLVGAFEGKADLARDHSRHLKANSGQSAVPRPRLLFDTGPLIALINRRDRHHAQAVEFLGGYFGELLTTWPVLTETTHQIPLHFVGPFLKLMRGERVRVFELPGALPRIAELMARYADRPMDLADASLVWVAEQTRVAGIVTLYRDDFSIYRAKNGNDVSDPSLNGPRWGAAPKLPQSPAADASPAHLPHRVCRSAGYGWNPYSSLCLHQLIRVTR